MQRRARLFLLAVAIGATVPAPLVFGRAVLGFVHLNRGIVVGYMLLALLAAAPFAALASREVTDKSAWLAGAAISILIWGFLFVALVVQYPLNSVELSTGAGAMVLASPALVGAAMWIASAGTTWRLRRTKLGS